VPGPGVLADSSVESKSKKVGEIIGFGLGHEVDDGMTDVEIIIFGSFCVPCAIKS